MQARHAIEAGGPDTLDLSWEATLDSAHGTGRRLASRLLAAGGLLDRVWGKEAVGARRQGVLAGEEFPFHPSAYQIAGPGDDEDTRFLRLNCVVYDLTQDPPHLGHEALDDPTGQAELIVLVACLATDRLAGEYLAGVTELATLEWDDGVHLGRGWLSPELGSPGSKKVWQALIERAVRILDGQFSQPAGVDQPTCPRGNSALPPPDPGSLDPLDEFRPAAWFSRATDGALYARLLMRLKEGAHPRIQASDWKWGTRCQYRVAAVASVHPEYRARLLEAVRRDSPEGSRHGLTTEAERKRTGANQSERKRTR